MQVLIDQRLLNAQSKHRIKRRKIKELENEKIRRQNNPLPMIKKNLSSQDLFFNSYAQLKGLDTKLNALLLELDSDLVKKVKESTTELRHLTLTANNF